MDNNTSARKIVLKPANLMKNSEQQNGNSLNNENGNSFAFSNNPFLKCSEKEEIETTDAIVSSASTTKSESNASDLFKPAMPTNLFTNATTLAENSNFVFGQNLRERVVMDKEVSESASEKLSEAKDGLLFSSALLSNSSADTSKVPIEEALTQEVTKDLSSPSKAGDKTNNGDEISHKDQQQEHQQEGSSRSNSISLVEAARKYEEMKGAQKRKYEEVEVITGEEDEENILEINCKLFTFENSNYEERGRGTLRLNDTKCSSRVVFRASGSYRVLLNTKVWQDQMCEKASTKSLRLTAFNSDGLLKIYLVMGRIEDVDRLADELQKRIEREKKNNQTEQSKIEVEPAQKKLAAKDE